MTLYLDQYFANYRPGSYESPDIRTDNNKNNNNNIDFRVNPGVL